MKQARKNIILSAAIISAAVLFCGFLGYSNDPRHIPSVSPGPGMALSVTTDPLIKLNYCYPTAPGLCIVSFGQDVDGNSLIVIRNDIQSLKQFYVLVTAPGSRQVSPCQLVQFSYGVFYCTDVQLQDGAQVTIAVYTKDDNRLIASGPVPVSVKATPTQILEITTTPTGINLSQTPTRTLTHPAPIQTLTVTAEGG